MNFYVREKKLKFLINKKWNLCKKNHSGGGVQKIRQFFLLKKTTFWGFNVELKEAKLKRKKTAIILDTTFCDI